MSVEEQARVVESLPGEVTWEEMAMPEGDRHSRPKVETRDMLLGFFSRQRRQVYLGMELPVYYPGERRFAPDLLAVRDVETHERDKWVVSHEGKGLEWVMEVHVGGDRKKDAEYNVERYARLGIAEYFIYDRAREQLLAYRLPTPEAREYERIAPERGRYRSEVLGLDFELAGGELWLWAGNARLLTSQELVEQLQRLREEEARLREEEARRAEEAERRAEEAEQRLAELQAELERLRGTSPR
jgi:Uma2 family endonuclease